MPTGAVCGMKEEKGGKRYFKCEACGLLYRERKWAERCQAWCSAHQSCSMDITRHRMKGFMEGG